MQSRRKMEVITVPRVQRQLTAKAAVIVIIRRGLPIWRTFSELIGRFQMVRQNDTKGNKTTLKLGKRQGCLLSTGYLLLALLLLFMGLSCRLYLVYS